MKEWTSTRLKFLASMPITNGVGEKGEFQEAEWPRYIRTTDISGPRCLRSDTYKSLPPEIAAKAPVGRGDLLMTAAGATIGKSYLHDSEEPACFAGYLVRFRARKETDPRFVAYWTESHPYWQQIEVGAVKSTIENFSAGRYRNLELDIPSFEKQRAIADFLDRETARIDKLLRSKRSLVNLIGSRLSRIEKLETLHSGNDPVPLRWHLQVGSGEGISPSDMSDHGKVPVIGGNGLMGYTDLPPTITRPCIAVGRVGAQCGNVHEVDPPAWITENALWIRDIQGFDRSFLAAALKSADLNILANRTAQPLITSETVKSLRLPKPTMSDQRRVVERLERSRGRATDLQKRLMQQLELLVEHRQALVTAAVTGQLRIPEAA